MPELNHRYGPATDLHVTNNRRGNDGCHGPIADQISLENFDRKVHHSRNVVTRTALQQWRENIPYSASQFRTLRCPPLCPGCFTGPQHVRTHFQAFFPWYNTQYRHSGLGLLTPDTVHCGLTQQIQAARQ